MVVSTWTAASADMLHVHEFLQSGVISASCWIVDRSFQNRQPELCGELRRLLGDDAIRIQRVHSKFVMLSDGLRYVTIQTSANLNRNQRIENVSVSSCPVFFDAYSMLVRKIFDTQLPGEGFEGSVTESFKKVAKSGSKKRNSVPEPW